jgi:hypothetical protein
LNLPAAEARAGVLERDFESWHRGIVPSPTPREAAPRTLGRQRSGSASLVAAFLARTSCGRDVLKGQSEKPDSLARVLAFQDV